MDLADIGFRRAEVDVIDEIRDAIRGETLDDGSDMFWVFNDTDGERWGPYRDLATAEKKLKRATSA